MGDLLTDAILVLRRCLEAEEHCVCGSVGECQYCAIDGILKRYDGRAAGMGTNYHWKGGEHDGIHIGKLSSLGAGRGVKFTWAADPVRTILALGEAEDYDDVFVEGSGNEDGNIADPKELLHILALAAEFDYTLIGHVFS